MRRTAAIVTSMVLFLFADLSAQQQPVYSQYMLDKYIVNPAISGANGFTTFNFISRQQYVGFENAPRTFTINAQTRLLEDSYILRRLKIRKNTTRKSRSGRVGIGASIFNDRNGIINRSGIQGTYSYHVNIENQWQLSGGLSILGYQYSIDDRDIPLADPDDPLLTQGKNTFFIPDANAGVFATNGKLYGGITLTDLLGSGLKIGREVYTNYETLRKYNIIAGYKITVSSLFSVEPSFLLQGTRTNFSLDVNARLNYIDQYWAGISYRSNNSLIMVLGGWFDRFFLGYAFDLNMGPINTYASGSHEVMFGLRLGDNNLRRFRWFRQDQRNYDI